MRKLILKISISTDGFVGGPNGELDWIFTDLDQGATEWTVAQISKAGAHLMGRKTFHDMAAYWPSSSEPFAQPMNEIPKIVFSRRGFDPAAAGKGTAALADATRIKRQGGANTVADLPASAKTWAEATVLTGDMTQEIQKLKKQPGKDLVAHGGAGFAQNLVQTGEIDEYWLLVHPVVLGRGLPLFSQVKRTTRFELLSSKQFASGAIANMYRVRA
jgi:dihydrofolate reductase